LTQKEQFFLHESTINSLLYAYSDMFMPLPIENTNITNNVLMLFPEFRHVYG